MIRSCLTSQILRDEVCPGPPCWRQRSVQTDRQGRSIFSLTAEFVLSIQLIVSPKHMRSEKYA